MKALRLKRGVGRYPADRSHEAVAAFDPPAEALGIEAGGEMIAGEGEANPPSPRFKTSSAYRRGCWWGVGFSP